jgi:hypothetical protein
MLDRKKSLREQLKATTRTAAVKRGVVFEVSNLAFPVSLTLKHDGEFTVRYGQIVRTGLDVDEAAIELGQAILFALVRSGRISGK